MVATGARPYDGVFPTRLGRAGTPFDDDWYPPKRAKKQTDVFACQVRDRELKVKR
jgi:hypothetical protein